MRQTARAGSVTRSKIRSRWPSMDCPRQWCRYLLTVPCLAWMLLPALAQGPQSESLRLQLAQNASKSSINDANRNAKLADAASINEDLMTFALEGKGNRVVEKVVAMRKTLSTLRSLFDETAFEGLTRQINDMERASSQNDVLGTALVSVEVYRTMENAMNAVRRPYPVEVAMMDYSGFKLSILAAAPTAEWETIAATAKESDTSWSLLARKVQDNSMRNLVSAIQTGLKAAVERKDIYGVRFAAKLQLEVVDVLEQHFRRVKKDKSGAR
jgi:hypothetical protein